MTGCATIVATVRVSWRGFVAYIGHPKVKRARLGRDVDRFAWIGFSHNDNEVPRE